MSFRLIVLLIISVSSCTPKTYPEEDKKKGKKIIQAAMTACTLRCKVYITPSD